MAKLKLKSGKELELELVEKDDGSVEVKVVGDCAGHIAKIKPSGYLYREPHIKSDIGFKLDDQYRIKLAKNSW